jgi:transposase-like protein
MLSRCPNPNCNPDPNRNSPCIVKNGAYYRPSDGKWVKRMKCKTCKLHFSEATFQKPYRHNKRRINPTVFNLLCSGVSMRRTALLLNVHRKTVARKLAFLAHVSRERQEQFLKNGPKVQHFQFDDLITIEHTKCKPLAVSLAVEKGGRRLLGFEVSRIPASGLLAEISRRKYGRRPNQRPRALRRLLARIRPLVEENVSISSDEDPLYPPLVRRNFPKAVHHRYPGGRGCVTGQGELKKLGFDPLFSLNHTCAMLRANINRLFRRTWCTTKKMACLEQHLTLYMDFHNTVLLKRKGAVIR